MKTISILFIIVLLVVSACGVDKVEEQPTSSRGFTFDVVQTQGFGPPVTAFDELHLKGNTLIFQVKNSEGGITSEQSTQLSAAEIEELAQMFETSGFFTSQQLYKPDQPVMDAGNFEISARLDGKQNKVLFESAAQHFSASVSPELRQLTITLYGLRQRVERGRACPADAKQCLDGSYVERRGVDCEFDRCPGEFETLEVEEGGGPRESREGVEREVAISR
ncbi:hypothetical protein J4457_02375 [Candidatus Woesearchaeota archaeon]|nr:hypothetical protein [Candidatus Woesearchaeota archaeon]